MTSEPYTVLGLPRGASYPEVRRAYRHLALESHPDTSGPAGVDRFITVQSAYEAISRETVGSAYGSTGAAIVPRSAVVPDTVTVSPPPQPPPLRIDLLASRQQTPLADAVEAYLRLVRIAPPPLVDICG